MKDAFDVSLSGLVAQRQRMNVIAGNIANANATQDADGNPVPFRRRMITFAPERSESGKGPAGVDYEVELDYDTPFREVYKPGHKHADENGIVRYPNVDIIMESISMMEAARAYEANVAAIEITNNMTDNSYRILG